MTQASFRSARNTPMGHRTQVANPPSRARIGADRPVFHAPRLSTQPGGQKEAGNARFQGTWATCTVGRNALYLRLREGDFQVPKAVFLTVEGR